MREASDLIPRMIFLSYARREGAWVLIVFMSGISGVYLGKSIQHSAVSFFLGSRIPHSGRGIAIVRSISTFAMHAPRITWEMVDRKSVKADSDPSLRFGITEKS
jgi:hypothetical protein